MANVFAYQSSQVDWCEDNFQFSEKVAEFYNMISNVSFFISAPIMMYLLHPYAQKRNKAVYLIWIMVMLVGCFSAYYHMTLSYFGQLLDELSILWVLAIAYMLWFPKRHLKFIKSRCTDQRIIHLAFATVAWWFIAISCWLSDRLLCAFWRQINFYYLHSFWHVLINMAVVHGATLFAYFDAFYEIPETNPEVKYWPENWRYLSVPYLAIKMKDPLQKSC
ncbi:alkaline ceramidase 1 isoform X2 [Pristis pectinata]|uniref:alkaline ceramidase 1 isoform X2 n=1 Tax=Pristis pectinata TaxID=685728 RepID=UPI00223D2EFF|nr:alkaline ceramidase 1 isoform X2 [Pristis pectinata]